MAKQNSIFDERAFLEAMSQGHRFGPRADTPAPAETPVDAPPATATPSPRRRAERISDYEAVFLAPREPLEKRTVVGLRLELYEVIATIVKRIGCGGVSAQAFVENVLRHHFSEYQDEINRLNREKLKKDIL
jgi:hypothetical protein